MLAGDLALVGADEVPVTDDLLARDIEPIDAMRAGEDEAGDGIGGAAELEPVGGPHRDVGTLASGELADVVAAEDGRASTRAEAQRIARRQRGRAVPGSRDKESLLDLEEEVAALVRCRAVDAEADVDACIQQLADRCETGSEPHVRAWTVCDADAAPSELRDVVRGEMYAVGEPDVVGEPAELLDVLDGRAAEALAGVRLFLAGLGQVRVQLESEPTGEFRGLSHQLARDGERRTRSSGDLDGGSVGEPGGLLGRREHVVAFLDERVR